MSKVIKFFFTTVGVAFFLYLLRSTGVTVERLQQFHWAWLPALFLATSCVVVLDSVAWQCALSTIHRTKLHHLILLRIAGDSLTTSLPGGVILGEGYKAAMLKQWYGIDYANNIAVLMISRFAMGLSQCIFVAAGLVFVYQPLRERSQEILGISAGHHLALLMTVAMATMIAVGLFVLLRGSLLQRVSGWLAKLPIPQLKRFLVNNQSSIASFDAACRQLLRDHKRAMLGMLFFYTVSWFAMAGETYALLGGLQLAPTIKTALAIEAVGSLFRLVFFMVPAGVGGQDLSFVKLFQLFGKPIPSAGIFVLLKRLKEIAWIGLGFILLALVRPQKTLDK